MDDTKVCQSCGLEKPLDDFYPGAAKCKSCILRANKERRIADAPDKAARKAEKAAKALAHGLRPTRVCRTCDKEKPVSEFYLKRMLASGAPLYRPDCSECECKATAADSEKKERIRAKTAEWRETDPERARLSVRAYQADHKDELSAQKSAARKDPEKRPHILALDQASRIRNRVKIRQYQKLHVLANKEKYKAYMKAYWKANPDKAAEYHNRRRALKLAASGTFTAEDIADIRRMQKDRCANPACRIKLNGKGHVDHRVALSKGGSNDRRNCQVLCRPCNSAKRASDEIDFMQSQGFLI